MRKTALVLASMALAVAILALTGAAWAVGYANPEPPPPDARYECPGSPLTKYHPPICPTIKDLT